MFCTFLLADISTTSLIWLICTDFFLSRTHPEKCFERGKKMKLPALVFMAIIFHSWQHSTAFPTPDCVGSLKTLRAVFALDCSGSVSDESWKITIDFAKKFITDLFEKVQSPQITIEYFSSSAAVISEEFSSDLESLLVALDTPRCSGGTNFPSNLQSLFDGLDADATKLLLFISDGAVNDIELAGPLKESGVTIFTVGIGSVTVDSLESICSQPPSEFMNLMLNYDELPIIVDELINKLTTVGVRFVQTITRLSFMFLCCNVMI